MREINKNSITAFGKNIDEYYKIAKSKMVNRKANLVEARTLTINNKLAQSVNGPSLKPFLDIVPYSCPLYFDKVGGGTDYSSSAKNTSYSKYLSDSPFHFVNGNVALGKLTPECTLDITGDVKINGSFFLNGRPYSSLNDLVQDSIIYGDRTFVGNTTMKRLSVLKITVSEENNNTIFGSGVLDKNAGSYNTGIGYQALRDNITGCNNTAVGFGSLLNNTSGICNNAYGSNCLQQNTTGVNNCGFGFFSLINNTVGTQNCAFGAYSLVNNVSGNKNIGIGNNAGLNNLSGSNNIYLGDSADTANGAISNSIAIGTGVKVTDNNQIVLGTDAHTTIIPGRLVLNAPFTLSKTADFVAPGEGQVGQTINATLESVYISLDGSLVSAGYIALDVGVWMITYGVSFTAGSGSESGAQISRMIFGLSENVAQITSNIHDSTQQTTVSTVAPYSVSGMAQIVTNTSAKNIYLLGAVNAVGEPIVFGGQLSATRIA